MIIPASNISDVSDISTLSYRWTPVAVGPSSSGLLGPTRARWRSPWASPCTGRCRCRRARSWSHWSDTAASSDSEHRRRTFTCSETFLFYFINIYTFIKLPHDESSEGLCAEIKDLTSYLFIINNVSTVGWKHLSFGWTGGQVLAQMMMVRDRIPSCLSSGFRPRGNQAWAKSRTNQSSEIDLRCLLVLPAVAATATHSLIRERRFQDR